MNKYIPKHLCSVLLYICYAVLMLAINPRLDVVFTGYVWTAPIEQIPFLDCLREVVSMTSIVLQVILILGRSHLVQSMDRKPGLWLNSFLVLASILMAAWFWGLAGPIRTQAVYRTTVVLLASSMFDELCILIRRRKSTQHL